MDLEYSVIGRVARRIWAVAMKNKYGANERSPEAEVPHPNVGRSLHAQEMDFNDIRTTLQALIAIYDNCNSLYTNACYDEAITTPTEESVRRAMAIQLIINREWGLAKTEPGAPSSSTGSPTWSKGRAPGFIPSSSAGVLGSWKPASSAARSGRVALLRAQSTTAPTRSSAINLPSTRRAWPNRRSNSPAPPGMKSRTSCPPRRLPPATPPETPQWLQPETQTDGHRERQRVRG